MIDTHSHEAVEVGGVRLDPLAKELCLADSAHSPTLSCVDELAVVVFREPLGGEGTARDTPEQQTTNGVRMAESEQQSGSAAGRAAAGVDGKGAELLEQLMEVVCPDLVFGLAAVLNDDVG